MGRAQASRAPAGVRKGYWRVEPELSSPSTTRYHSERPGSYGRDKKGHDDEKRQREHELNEVVEYEEAAEERREEYEEEKAEEELGKDE